MGIDAKGVAVSVWKILRFSTSTTCRYVKRYPVVSCVSTFFFLLYAFLPWVFYFLLCSSPLIAFPAFYLRSHLSSNPWRIRNSSKEKKTDKGSSSSVQKGSDSGDGRNTKPHLRPQRSVRRNARGKVEEVGKDWDSLQASEGDRNRVILTTLYGELPSSRGLNSEKFMKDKTLLVAEESLFDHVVDGSFNTEDVVLDSSEKVPSGGETGKGSSSSEEEKSHEINKTFPWTVADKNSSMDLGISEMERNKRLENLIAKRRTRKVLLLAAERSLRNIGLPPISVERKCFGLDHDSYDIDELQMPGSAPSVLLPTRNPFDLPYDPQEEKPDLSGDSFLQEFSVGNQRNVFLCRHQSFSRGIFPPEKEQDFKFDPWRKATTDGQRFARIKPRQDGCNRDGLVEQPQPLTKEIDLTRREGNNMESSSGHGSEVHTETGSIRNDDSDSSSSLSPRASEKDSNQTRRNGDHIGSSLVGLVPRNNGSSSLGAERQKYMEHFGYSTNARHMVTHSVDSDLQVEVSETGSSPTAVYENDYSDDEKSLFVYESEVGREMGFCREDTEMKPNNVVDKSEMLPVEISDRESTQSQEDPSKPSENPADEIKISYDSDEAGPSETNDQESQGHCKNGDGDEPAIEMQQVVETEASDVENGNSDGSASSPMSVLPDVLSLDQTYSLHSEYPENILDGHPQSVNVAPELLQNQSAGGTNTEEPENSLNLEESGPSTEERDTLENSSLDSQKQETYGLNPEDEECTLEDRSLSGNGSPVSFQNQSADGRNI